MARDARGSLGDLAMFGRALTVNIVARDARRVRFTFSDLADVLSDVPISRVHVRKGRVAQINLVVVEQVIARDEIGRIGQAALLRFARAQVTLRAVGELHPRRIGVTFAEGNQLGVLGVAQVHEAVTRVAVERDGREGVCLRVDGRRVASRAVFGKNLFVPVNAPLYEVDWYLDRIVGALGLGQHAASTAADPRLCRRVSNGQHAKLSVFAGPLEKANFSPGAEQVGDTLRETFGLRIGRESFHCG